MVNFMVSSSVRRVNDHEFLAIVCATPFDAACTAEPDERTRLCGTVLEAREAELDLASELSYEINARGDRVVDIQIA